MEIKLTCQCGASISLKGSMEINPGMQPDKNGRVYQIEIVADAWLDRHKTCLEGFAFREVNSGS